MKLATFETIDRIDTIEGKDRIVLITIKGFEMVVGVGRFKVGDMCVYVPPDTLIDRTKPWFETFKNNRVKTEKIAGCYSQGIVLTTVELKDSIPDYTTLTEDEIDEIDLGPLIGVTKYEKDISVEQSGGTKRQNVPLPEFPSHLIPITDEGNLKSVKNRYMNILMGNELLDKVVNVTMKMDGTSTTLIWHSIDTDGKFCSQVDDSKKGSVFIMASRNYSLYKDVIDCNGFIRNEFDYPDDKTTYIKKHNLVSRFIGKNIAIQGELCGPKIGGNKLGFDKLEFFVFTIRDLDTNEYFSYKDIVNFCTENGLIPVPLIDSITVTEETDLKFFQETADKVKYVNPKTGNITEGEGIVVRPETPFLSRGLGCKNCSFKLINRKYKD